MFRFIASIALAVVFLIPAVSFAATTQNQLGEGHALPLKSKDNIFAFIFTPKDWDDRVLGDGSGGVTIETEFADVKIGGSIDVSILDLSEDGWWKGKSKSWIVKNYIQKTIIDSFTLSNVKRGKVTIDGVSGNYMRYTFDKSTYLVAVYTKGGEVYVFHAQTPNAHWKSYEQAIEQTLSTFHTGKLNHLR